MAVRLPGVLILDYKFHISDDSTQLAENVAQLIVDLATDSISKRGRFSIAFAGGSTPKATYQLLSDPGLSTQIDWDHFHVFCMLDTIILF